MIPGAYAGRVCNSNLHRFLVTLVLLGICANTTAQHQRFINYSIANGLPSEIIYAITQSSSGYLWFGSAVGITRFDGASFRSSLLHKSGNLRPNDNDTDALPGESVQYLHSSGQSVYAALESSGLAIVDESMRLQRLLIPENTPSMPSRNIWSMASGGTDELWVGFADAGVALLNTRDYSFTSYPLPGVDSSAAENDKDLSIMFIYTDDHQAVWVATLSGALFRKAAGSSAFVNIKLPEHSVNTASYIRSVTHYDQHVYAVAGAHLYVLDKDSGVSKYVISLETQLGVEDPQATSIVADQHGELWIGSRKGLFRLRPDAASATILAARTYRHSPVLPDSISSNDIYFNFNDESGGLWFASMNRGINHMPAGWDAVSLLYHDPLAEKTLPGERARSLLADGDELWIGTFNNGLARYNQRLHQYTTPDAVKQLGEHSTTNRILALGKDLEGRLWAGTVYGLIYYTEATGIQSLAMEPELTDAMSSRLLFAIFDTGARVWALARSRYAMYLDNATRTWRLYEIEQFTDAEQDYLFVDFANLADGRFLLATERQLLMYSVTCDCMQSVIPAGDQRIQSMTVADRQLFLVRGETLQQYQITAALPELKHTWKLPRQLLQTEIINLLKSGENTLWLTSKQHIFRLELSATEDAITSSRMISRSDGLANTEIERNMLVGLAHQQLAVATTRGVTILDPERLAETFPVPRVILEQLRTTTNNISLNQGQRTPIYEHSLSHDENTLFINYQSILFNYREQLEFQYRLRGWDTDWISNSNSNQVIYSNLAPGNYQFQVRARISDRPWGPVNDNLRIAIQRPPWLSTWALTLYAIAVIVLMLLAWQRHRRNLRQQQALVLARERQKFARQQSELATLLSRSIQPQQIAAAIYATISARLAVQAVHINFRIIIDEWFNFPENLPAPAAGAKALYQLLEQQPGMQIMPMHAAGMPAALLLPLGSEQPLRALALIYPEQAQQPDQETLGFLSLTGNMAGSAVNNFELLQQVTELAESSKQANQAKSEFIAMVSHEIRTPLHGVMGMLHMLSTGQDQQQHQDTLKRVNQSSKQLLTVLDDVLDISKIEAKKVELSTELFCLIDLCQNLEQLFSARVQEKNIYLACMVAPDCNQWRSGDRDRCMQILTNLVSNAIKFTDRGGVMVCIHGGKQQHAVIIEVMDTGIGIGAVDQQRLFQRFQQVGQAGWRRYGGSGLGLAISHHLAQVLGGALTVSSTPGHGSIFTATLPLPAPASLAGIDPVHSATPLLLHLYCERANQGLTCLLQGLARSKSYSTGAAMQTSTHSVNIVLSTAVDTVINADCGAALLRGCQNQEAKIKTDSGGQHGELTVFNLSSQWDALIAWLLAQAGAFPQ